MTSLCNSHTEKGPETKTGRFLHFDHLKFWVGNAKQAAQWYCVNFGFEPYAYSGLETGSRNVASHVIKQNNIIFVFESALTPDNREMGNHLMKHGDGVRDIAFTVEDLNSILDVAKKRGANVIEDIYEVTDEHGIIRVATISTYGDTVHTLIERSEYNGLFMPGYISPPYVSPMLSTLRCPNLILIDHVAGNQPDLEMENVVNWYDQILSFHRFWSVDESVAHADYTSLRFIVVTNDDETIKLPIIEPAESKQRAVSQVKEFVDYYGGAGVQHIALHTDDIITAVTILKSRGVQFLTVPDTYYGILDKKLKNAKITVVEDLQKLQELKIMIDFDDKGYLLQIFTKPLEDRPTMFIEIIQRRNHRGFGNGNFKSLFEAMELEQHARGNLFNSSHMNGNTENGTLISDVKDGLLRDKNTT